MTKAELMALGVPEELAEKLTSSLQERYVPKDQHDELTHRLEQAEATVAERDGQLETLRRDTGDVEALRQTIADLQVQNRTQAETHEAALRQERIDRAVEKALSNAINPKTVTPLLNLEGAELLEDGTVKGLGDQIKQLAQADDTRFLFKEDKPARPILKGYIPGERSDGPPRQSAAAASLGDAVRMMLEAQATE